MIDHVGIDWEDAFSNAAYIADGVRFPSLWAVRAAAFRERTPCELDVPYGDRPRERFDLFFPAGAPKGLAVIIHGGYWLDFDKSSWSDLAEGALTHGWAVALPSYTLAPEARIPEITRQVSRAISAAAGLAEGPVRLAGHSAGGHLATKMVCENSPLPQEVTTRIERVVSISGLHDLRPLLLHSMNEDLGLDAETAAAESPALSMPVADLEVTAWVGANERPEFLRQSALLAESWRGQGLQSQLVVEPERHHFDVIDGLKAADHPLALAFAGD
ncbi:MAG: alpha/beta hydrolase [Boseongicola sp. SB0677_bin_26]|nr:alpha/beta hydrolase [Boseongicola sp. SB0665_bin_10]MYG25283.1 alpha/beta hydrolase [Boseongicola sp. SB0677_bin_26]